MTSPLAENLNNDLKQSSIEVYEMLSNLGKEMFYPKGILSQSAKLKVRNTMQQSGWQLIITVKCMLIH